MLKYGANEGTLICDPEKTQKMPRRNCDYRASLTKDQILSTYDIFVTSLHYDLTLNLSALLGTALEPLTIGSIMVESLT